MFVWITVGMLVALVLSGVALAMLLAHEADSIERSGGWGWLLIGGIYVTAATVVCLACAACAAISLLRGEAHRRLSVALLIVACLEVWVFKGSLAYVVRGAPAPVADAAPDAVKSDSLVRHFQSLGIDLEPLARSGGFETEWLLEDAGVGPRCEIFTRFKQFPRETPVATMRTYLMAVSLPSVLNEDAALAMFHPGARGKTSDVKDCEGWAAKSTEITDRVVDAFRSYRSPPAGERP